MASGLSRRGRPEGSAASSHTRGQKGQPPAQQGQAGQKEEGQPAAAGSAAGAGSRQPAHTPRATRARYLAVHARYLGTLGLRRIPS
jgi:hypothetical protein